MSFAFWFRASGLAKMIQGSSVGKAKGQEKQADRDAKVSRIQIYPGDITIDFGDHVAFSAVAYDQTGTPVSGVKIKWTTQSAIPTQRVRLSQRGELEAISAGTFSVTAQAAGRTAQATVVVRPGLRRNLNLAPTGTHQVSSRDVPSMKIGLTKPPKKGESNSSATAVRQRDRSAAVAKRAHVTTGKISLNPAVAPMPQGGGGGWNDSNAWSADKPENSVGAPAGAAADGGAGSGNFQFASPILSLPGRGINVALGLAYNSRVWNKAGNQISFDNDRGWPAPGFSLGFGKLLGMGVYSGGMLIEGDGTRRSYTGSIASYSWGTHGVMHTTDGSLIDYSYSTGTGGGIVNALAQLPNGTRISYGAAGPGVVYPTSIEDANGNFIAITYVNNIGPRIQTITDSLNRTISFYYDANSLLTAIAGPGLNGGSRTLVRLHYQQLNLAQYSNYGFGGAVSASTRDVQPWVIDAIYYPATNTGYWLGDSDSYSSFGMLAKVVEERAMGFSASSLNDMGIVSQGSITRSETYNYPLTPDYSLTDAPTYTAMTEAWTRDGTNFDSAITNYDVNENASPRTTTIMLPNGTKSTQLAYNHQGQYDNGLVYYDETRDANNNLLQSSSVAWEQGAYGSPRPTRIQKTDEHQQTTAAEFSYGTFYNQVTEVRDYDYGGAALLRATRTQYENSANYTGSSNSYGYTGRHIFNLPLNVEVYASDSSTRVSRIDYQYDSQTLTDAPNVVMHDDTADPYTTDTTDYCCDWEWDPLNSYEYCAQWCSQSVFDPSTNSRGNVTQATTYADAVSLTSPVTEARFYDITGNLVTANTSQQISINYTINTQYAYPESKTRGSATDPYAQVTTSATYDFNTGLASSATDANGRPSQTSYDATTSRTTSATMPTGARTDYSYDDSAMSITATTYLAATEGSSIADKNVKLLNGLGQIRKEQALGVNTTWDFVDTVYNNMGQVSQQSRPYRSGDTPVWTTALYDALGRPTRVTTPDGSVTETYYNEEDFDPNDSYVPSRPDAASAAPGETRLVRDAWGRERWGRTDASGRLVEVVEPNPSGNGSVATGGLATSYTYNTLGNLIQINQGVQTRTFRYDALGRLTAQKLAEASATLNDAGTYVGSGSWSDVLAYDDRSNLTSRTDARGVKTVYTFNGDPLNRLQSVSWDTSGFGDSANPILPAATVSYQYRSKAVNTSCDPTDSSGRKDVTQLTDVITSGVSTESQCYDTEGRVSSKTLTLNSRTSYPFVTDYSFDSLDRITDVRYPAEYGNGAQPRKVVHHDYDIASRLTALSYDSQSFASSIIYNASSQTTSLNIGTGANQVTENYSYNSQTGLLDGQTVVRGGSTLLDLSYDYAGANGKRTGRLTRILNNRDHNKDRGYSYDALGRLIQATGGPSGSFWTESYCYDRWGNRTSVTATGHSAKLEKPADPKAPFPTDLLAKNNGIELPEWLREKDKNPISDTSTPLYGSSSTASFAKVSNSTQPLAPQSGSTKIAFASNRDGSSQIYVMNTDGTNQARLTNNQTNDESPRWSSNNSRIVFQSDRDNPFCDLYDIYVMNADGSGQARLTSDPNDDSAPVWSPDGTKIAFQSLRNGVNYQVYVMNADGSGQVDISNSSANDTQPAWSPDGSKISFASDRGHTGVFSLYVMNSNGSSQMNISNNSYDDEQPAWSSDGSRLAFMSERDSTTDTWTETDDNGNILYRSRVNINKEIYVMNTNGSGQTRLTNTLENDESAAWSGDGTKIVFRSDRERDCCDPTAQVWMMNPDGSGQVDLSNNGGGDYSPSWQLAVSNIPPSVSITAPANGASFNAPANVTITASVGDIDGYVIHVDFYNGANLIGTATSSPYTINWNNVAAGSYSITARATDNAGATTTSTPVAITVSAPAIPVDGTTSVSYNQTSNQITTAGFAYDAAGNQIRALIPGSSSSQRFRYDAASRMVQVVADDNTTVVASYTFGDSNERIISDESGYRTYLDCEGGATIAEYVESGGSTAPAWSKGYVYLGGRLLSTLAPNGSGGEAVQFHHPDRLGTRLVTDPTTGGSFEQVTLPFGTALNAESSGATTRRFTTYDRNPASGTDYAYNRSYDAQQGRFMQSDPIGMGSVERENPQTLNLYAYCINDPVNQADPSGLGFFSFIGKVFKGIWRVITSKWFAIAVTIALALISFGSSMGWWSLISKVTKFIELGDLGYGPGGGITITMTHLSTLGWITAGLTAAVAIPGLTTIKGVLSAGIGFGMGQAFGLLAASGASTIWSERSGVGPVASFKFDGGDDDDVVKVQTWARGPWWDKLRNFLAGVIDYGVGPPPIPGLSNYTLGRLLRKTADRLGGSSANEKSWSYYVGSWVPDVVAWAAGAGATVDAADGVGATSKIFGRHKIGALNRNDYLRAGWSWKGSASQGQNVFRIAIGSKRGAVHIHITLWPR